MAIAMNGPEKALEHFRAKLGFTISPTDLDRELKAGTDACVIDVRDAKDFEAGHIPGSLNLPKQRWGTLEGLDKDKPNVLVGYSQTCHLAARAAVEFSISGFSVVEMDGGFAAWRDQQLPIERSDGETFSPEVKSPSGRAGKRLRELMSPHPIRLPSWAQVTEAARKMSDAHVGSIVVEDDGKLCGIVTDRDVTIRAVAQGLNPSTTTLGEICSTEVVTLSPDDDVERALEVMRERAVRRLLVVDGGRAVGIVSLGDLAIERDARSVLGEISGAPPTD
jgi:CBS domain-containing protein/rhodanese-related sulfurtransferase